MCTCVCAQPVMGSQFLSAIYRVKRTFWMVTAVAGGGAVGGSLRYLFLLAYPSEPGAFPWVVFGANIAGAFLLGLAVVWFARKRMRRPYLQAFLTTGLLGSLTTFSNYTLDIVLLGEAGRPLLAATYALGALAAGVGAALGGLQVGRKYFTS